MSELETGFRLADVGALLRRRAGIVLAAVVVGAVLGYLAFSSSPPRYSATARVEVVIVDEPGSGTSAAAAQLSLGTESDLVKSDAVGDAVREELGLDTDNRTLFQNLTVTTRETSRVIGLTVQSESASKARDTVNAVARAYLDERARAATEERDEMVARLERQAVMASTEVSEAQRELDATAAGSAARIQAESALRQATQESAAVLDRLAAYNALETDSVGRLVREAPTPGAVLSRMALAKGVGVFGLIAMLGLGVAVLVDRRDSLGGGRRRVGQLAPGASIRLLPTATRRKAGSVEIDAAVDRLAVDLAGGGSRGRATSVLLAGTRNEPPIPLAVAMASSLTYAGIPALFVLAGPTDRELRPVHIVDSFSDLISGRSVTGPAGLPEVAGSPADPSQPLVSWLRPKGSAESSGLLRRAVVEALISRAGREGFEAVVFVAATPTLNAAAAALGQWVTKVAVVVEGDESQPVERAVKALREADVDISEVVWT